MAQLLTLMLIVIAVIASWRFLRTTPLARLSPAAQSWLWLSVVILVVLALTGRLGLLIPLIGTVVAAGIALVSRLLPVLLPILVRHLPRGWGASTEPLGNAHRQPGGLSSVQSRYLRMQLDQALGRIQGEILEGPHSGCTLDQLDREELMTLHTHYIRVDTDSAKLLEAYLQQRFGASWRSAHSSNDAPRPTGMSRNEALDILGLEPEAGREQIIETHRRLIQKLHPDRGGSDYLAAKINQAKGVLLND